MSPACYHRYVAIGDSTTEGLDDPDGLGGYRGWADRLAERLSELAPDFRYANLAVRGLLTQQIRASQLDPALSLAPDLATVVAGMNDLLRPKLDLAAYRADLLAMFGALSQAGTQVLTFTLPDLGRVTPIARPLGRRRARMNALLREVAQETGARVLELDRYPVARTPRLWSDDRLHANSLGHARVALALAHTLALPGSDGSWATPLPDAPPAKVRARVFAELAWTRRHLLPWVGRHLRGRSSGDRRLAKRPGLLPVAPVS